MRGIKKIIHILTINLAVFIGLLLLAEGVARIMVPLNNESQIYDDRDVWVRDRPFVELSETRGFTLKPNYSEDSCHINQDGFRGENIPKDLGRKTVILALGASTTFGWEVKDDETYPAFLTKYFSEINSDAVVLRRHPAW